MLPSGEVWGRPVPDLVCPSVLPYWVAVTVFTEKETVEIQGYQNVLDFAPLFREAFFLRKCLREFTLHPGAGEGVLRAAKNHPFCFIESSADRFLDWLTGFTIDDEQPTSNTAGLKLIIELSGEFLIGMAVADKTGMMLAR